jgi:hypothetical protein
MPLKKGRSRPARLPRIDVHVHLPLEALGGVNARLDHLVALTHKEFRTMASTLRELQTELTDIKTGVQDLKTKAAALAQAQVEEIARLKQVIADGGAITQADLDGLDGQADEVLALLAPDAPPVEEPPL